MPSRLYISIPILADRVVLTIKIEIPHKSVTRHGDVLSMLEQGELSTALRFMSVYRDNSNLKGAQCAR